MKRYQVFFGATAIAVALVYAVGSVLSLPTVQVGRTGKCVRVLAEGEHGNTTVLPCSSIDLENGRYSVEHVFGTDAENKAFAAEIAANKKIIAARP